MRPTVTTTITDEKNMKENLAKILDHEILWKTVYAQLVIHAGKQMSVSLLIKVIYLAIGGSIPRPDLEPAFSRGIPPALGVSMMLKLPVLGTAMIPETDQVALEEFNNLIKEIRLSPTKIEF
jgi:hypothetical protein